MAAGHGGQVLVSRTVRDLLAGRLPDDVELEPLGVYRLKDLGEPENLYQLRHPELRAGFPELRTLNARLSNLPIEMTSFVGRHEEVREAVDRLDANRLVTLTGVGGSGKTRLAIQTAAEILDRFPDGVWLIELASMAEGAELPQRTADALGLTGGPTGGSNDGESAAPALQLVSEFLADRSALLVLDNCEHVISAAAEFADHVLAACPDLRMLATSREGLGVRGEQLIQVPSLSLPSALSRPDADVRSDAVELFAERATAASGFQLTDRELPIVIEICRRLDGMPLAIELAAARTRMFSVEHIAERLDDSFRILTGGSRTALARQQTLQATVEWSYELLSEKERLVFDRLAVFRGGFLLEAAEAVVSGDGVNEIDVFDAIASLVDKSMVQPQSEASRFNLSKSFVSSPYCALSRRGVSTGGVTGTLAISPQSPRWPMRARGVTASLSGSNGSKPTTRI